MAISAKRLAGWKAIAGHFSRDERTVMRWASDRGMPVERVAGHAGSSVYAWPDELDAWLRQSGGAPGLENAKAHGISVAAAEPARIDRSRAGWLLRRPVWPAAVAVAAIALAGVTWRMARPESSPGPIYAGFRDATARDAYLQARFDGSRLSHDSLLRAVAGYGEAISRDPGVAASYVGLASTYLILPQYSSMSGDEAFRRAAAAVQVALSISPGAMEVRRALASVAFWNADLPTARRQFANALSMAPRNSETHRWLAAALSTNGEQAAALKEIEIARTLDPASPAMLLTFGRISYLAGQRQQGTRALLFLERSDSSSPAPHRALAEIALFEGRHADYLSEAAAAARLAVATDMSTEIARQDASFRSGGAAKMFDTMIRDARARTLRTGSGFYELAQISAAVGRGTAAINALAPACTRHERAASGARGDLYIARQISQEAIRKLCGGGSLLN